MNGGEKDGVRERDREGRKEVGGRRRGQSEVCVWGGGRGELLLFHPMWRLPPQQRCLLHFDVDVV